LVFVLIFPFAIILLSLATACSPIIRDSYLPFHIGTGDNKVYGYLDRNGKVIIKPAYTAAREFSEGLAAVKIGGNWGYIDSRANVVVKPRFEDAEEFSQGLAAVKTEGKYGFVDREGRLTIRPAYAAVPFGRFSEGFAIIQETPGGKENYIDREGKILCPDAFNETLPFSEGLAPVESGGKWGFIDSNGKLIIPFQFEGAGGFSNGLAPVTLDQKAGFIEKSGRFLIKPSFDAARMFSEGLAAVKKGNRWAYINVRGDVVIDYRFDNAGTFSEGLANVKMAEGVTGFINRKGAVEFCPDVPGRGDFKNGVARIVLPQLGGESIVQYYSRSGKLIWESPRESGSESIFEAVKKKDTAAVRALLDRNPGLTGAVDPYTLTPLHWAAMNGDQAMAELLLARGVDINRRTRLGRTPLNAAIQHRRADMEKMLRAKGADPASWAWPRITGAYVGEPLPGFVPRLFSPEIFSSSAWDHAAPAFSKDGREAFWAVVFEDDSGVLMGIAMDGDHWTMLKPLPFSEAKYRDICPTLSSDGTKLFFTSCRPTRPGGKTGDYNMWVVDRTGAGWSEPRLLAPEIASGKDARPVFAADGTVFFGSWRDGAVDGTNIFFSKRIGDQFEKPKRLDAPFNASNVMPTSVSPDGRFLIFESFRAGGLGGSDFWASAMSAEGTWGPAVNLGAPVNSPSNEWFGGFSPDEKYFFFVSDRNGNNDIYWLEAAAIKNLAGQAPVAPAVAEAPALGMRGMVSSAHPLATEAGIEILKKGGNAFDAAVAVAAALNVVEPAMSGMGGYGTILVYSAADGKIRFLNSSGRIPSKLNPDIFRAPTPDYEKNRAGAAAVSTPGNVAAWEAMSKKYGKLRWKTLFEPALRLAGEGHKMNRTSARTLESAYETFPKTAQAIFGKNGVPFKIEDWLVQSDLANALKLVAEKGADAFYKGPIGQAIVAEIAKRGGYLSAEDLAECQAEWGDPIRINYRGYEVYTASPPATSFCSLIRLGIMGEFDAAALGPNTVAYLHRFSEASKHAFWCRLKYSGDPAVAPPPLDRLLSEAYFKTQAAAIDPARAKPFEYPGSERGPEQHTTHFVVADAEGNIVSATQTLGNAFGSRIMVPGTGIWMNNSLAYCTFEPKSNPMDAHPGRRKLSGDCPTIIVKDGRPWAALGTPGGHTIGQVVPQLVMNLIDFKMNIREALTAGRVSFVEPDILAVEKRIPQNLRDGLAALGHKVEAVERLGLAHGLTIAYGKNGKPSGFQGAADPRGQGSALGY